MGEVELAKLLAEAVEYAAWRGAFADLPAEQAQRIRALVAEAQKPAPENKGAANGVG